MRKIATIGESIDKNRDSKRKAKHEKNDPGAREKWLRTKVEGRPKQQWITDDVRCVDHNPGNCTIASSGHWEKI